MEISVLYFKFFVRPACLSSLSMDNESDNVLRGSERSGGRGGGGVGESGE